MSVIGTVIPDSTPVQPSEEDDMAFPKWAQEIDLAEKLAKLESVAADAKTAHARITTLTTEVEELRQTVAELQTAPKSRPPHTTTRPTGTLPCPRALSNVPHECPGYHTKEAIRQMCVTAFAK